MNNLLEILSSVDYEDYGSLHVREKPYALVSFYGKALDALSVVGALYARHVDLVEDWIPFHKYMNSEVLLAELIAGSFGMLADGPEPLVLAYAEVMQSYGFTTSHHSSVPPGDWVGESADLSVLILDKSHVIASAFLANALN